MDRMTDVAAFYDALAPDYDTMTDHARRLVQEGPHFRHLVARFGITAAVDAGAGTGFHSLLLTQLGVDVIAVDVSEAMLERLAQNATAYSLTIETVRSSFQDLPAHVHTTVDAVFCMGNGLAHLLTHEELAKALQAFRTVLYPGGVLIAQLLNYRRILASGERLQSVRDTKDARFLRYYTFGGENIRFNILVCPTRGGPRTLYSTELHPLQPEEVTAALEQAGFVDVSLYGNIALERFDDEASRDLVVLATAGPLPDASTHGTGGKK